MKNLYQKINEVMKQVQTVHKGAKISMGGGSYTAVSHDDVTSLLHMPCAEIGIVLIPNVISSEITSELKAPDKYGNIKKEYQTSVIVELTAINADNPEERLSVKMPAHAFDSSDKSPGKSISMATKYCYLKLFMLESIDEEEARPEAKYEQKIDYKKKDQQLGQIKTELAKKTTGFTTEQKQKFLTENLKVKSFKDVENMNNDELVNLYDRLSKTILK
jgi:hypothetical protein